MKRKRLFACLLLAVLFAAACNAGYACAAESMPGIDNQDMIYFILTDRFYDGDASNNGDTSGTDPKGYHGGDFQGIIDKLDYIKGLGFTAIWISPVVDNEAFGYHGYWTADFYKTEEHFGTLSKLKELVDTAHAKGLKVIADLVVNHTGARNKWVSDPVYADWFHDRGNIADWNNQSEVENGRLSGLPDLNTENPEVRKYLIEMAKWWIRQVGFDGYRLDTVRHVPRDFWTEFVAEIKKDYPSFYFLGEVFSGDVNYVAGYQQTGIDGITDFPVYYAINDVFGGNRPATRIAEVMESSGVYRDRSRMATFIDNHDVPRFVNQLAAFKSEKLMQALAFEMTYTGIPVLYYGTEVAMKGGADPDNRRSMDWSATSPITDFVKKLTALRKSNPALTQGDLRLLKVEEDLLCYSRTAGTNTILAVFNTSNTEKQAVIPIPPGAAKEEAGLTDLLGGGEFPLNGGKLFLDMAPRQVNLLAFRASEEPAVPAAAGQEGVPASPEDTSKGASGLSPWIPAAAFVVVVLGAILVWQKKRKE